MVPRGGDLKGEEQGAQWGRDVWHSRHCVTLLSTALLSIELLLLLYCMHEIQFLIQ